MENKINKNLERFVINIPDELIQKIEDIAIQNGVSMSWVYRSILHALETKFLKHFPDESRKIKRPGKFNVAFRQTVICFYGDKHKWLSLARFWHVELGPLIRFGLKLYLTGKLDIDLETLKTIKEIKKSNYKFSKRFKKQTNKNRYIHLYQIISDCYLKDEYWEKNVSANIILMKFGLANRKRPLNLADISVL